MLSGPSEIYLELNLSSEAKETAHEGYLRFQKLGMGYEEAKCQAYEAMASSQLGKALGSLELFAQARAKFVKREKSGMAVADGFVPSRGSLQ